MGVDLAMSRSTKGFLVVVVLVSLVQAFGQPSLQAGSHCGSPGSRPVTLLARPGAGTSFTTIGAAGAAPYLDNYTGTTMVPVRSLVAVISAIDGAIRWDEPTRTATFIRSGLSLSFSFDPGSRSSDRALVNGQSVAIHSIICDDRLYAPARFVSNALGVSLKWYPDGTVVVDPAWGLAGPTKSDPDLALLRATTSNTTTPIKRCEPVPNRLSEVLRSPVSAYWQATRATACQILRGA
jgi:hypothetical protein